MINKKRGNTKGLSTIVATLLIILLTLVAVGIIWVVIKNVLKNSADEVSIGKFSIDLEISRVRIINSNSLSVVVKRNPGEASLSGIAFVAYSSDESELIKSTVILEQLEEREFIIVLSEFGTPVIRKISIAPLLISDSGKEFIGNIQDEYIFPICGDGIKQAYEGCDDGDLENGDGCSDSCIVESGWICDTRTPNFCIFVGSVGIDYTWTGELLTNPGFESFLFGWQSSANFYVTTNSPQEGTYASYSQDASSIDSFIQQDVDLGSWQSYIDSGIAVINATGYGISLESPNHDRTRIQIIFLDSTKGVIEVAGDTGYIIDENWWREGVEEYSIPVGTRYVRVWGNTYDPDGSSSGSLDSFSVMLGYED